MLREYKFDNYKTEVSFELEDAGPYIMHKDPEMFKSELKEQRRSGTAYFYSDLINEPSNILTTEEFASRFVRLSKLGVKIEILRRMTANLGMNAFLGGAGLQALAN